MIVMVQVADLSHENFKSSQVIRWWLSRLSSRFGAKSSRERKPKWLPGLVQSRVKNKFLIRDGKCEIAGFRCLKEMGSKKTFLFRKTRVRFCPSAYDFTPGNWTIHGYRFSLWRYVDRINSFIQPIRYVNLVAGIKRFILARNFSE